MLCIKTNNHRASWEVMVISSKVPRHERIDTAKLKCRRQTIVSMRIHCCLCLFLLCISAITRSSAQPVPLTRVHAHNDYEHKRPLLDALDQGFCSVEADIYLVDGRLLVAHERRQVRPERTLQALYLDPLRERIKANGGRVYPHGPEVTLLIDLKNDWRQIYPVLRGVLKQYADVLVTFHDGIRETNALLAIITGDRSNQMFDGETVRYAALDGELADLQGNLPADVIPWISGNWYKTFMWRGKGHLDPEEKAKLKAIVFQAHQQRRKVRFWGAPDQPVFWQELMEDDVDLINTDDLAGARKFLLDHSNAIGK